MTGWVIIQLHNLGEYCQTTGQVYYTLEEAEEALHYLEAEEENADFNFFIDEITLQ